MLRVIVGLIALLALTQPARADVIITPFIVSLLSGAIGAAAAAAIAPTVASILITGVLIGVSLLLAKRPKLPEPADGKILVKSAVPPKQWGVGTSRQIGALIASEMHLATSYDVSAMHAGRISRYVTFYLHEDKVVFDVGEVDGPINNAVEGTGKYRGYEPPEPEVFLYWRLGLTPETAYSEMVAALPDTWTNNHRGDGIATVLCVSKTPKDKQFSKRFPNGLPKVSVVGDWTIAWDPRDVTQIRTDPSTWKFSDNPFVLLLDFYLHHEAGFRRDHELVYEPTSEYWIAAMDVCDELVPIGTGGTEKRYTASGRFDAETPRKSVVEAYLRCCDGYLEEIGGGAVVVYAGKFYPSNLTITDQDVIDDSVVFNRNDNETVNVVNVKVVSKEHDYNEVEADQMIYQPALDAGAPRKAVDVNAEFCSAWRQSRRLAKIELSRQNAVARGNALLTLNGENLKGRRFFRLDLPDRGTKLTNVWAEKKKLEDRVNSDGGWYVEYEIIDPARYDWTIAEEGAPPQVPDDTDNQQIPIPNTPTLSVIRKTAGGQSVILISATNPPVTGWPDLQLGGEYQQVGETTWTPMQTVNGALQCLSLPVVDGTYKVHTWFIGASGGNSDQSPDATISVVVDPVAPGTPITPTAMLSGSNVSLSVKSARNDTHFYSLEARRWPVGGPYDATTGVIIDGDAQVKPVNTPAYWDDTPGPGVHRYGFRAFNRSGVPSAAFAVATPDITIAGQVGSDDFNRADGAVGNGWLTNVNSGTPDAVISGNKVSATSGSAGVRKVFFHNLGTTKHYAEATYLITANGVSFPVAVRVIDANNYVGVRWSAGTWLLVKYVANSPTNLTPTAAQAGVPTNAIVRLEASGDTVVLKVNGTTLITTTLGGDLSTATGAGFAIRSAEGALLDDAKWGILP